MNTRCALATSLSLSLALCGCDEGNVISCTDGSVFATMGDKTRCIPIVATECASNIDCSGSTPACATNLGYCVECTGNSDCDNGNCDTTTYTCGGCEDNSDCTDPERGRCRQRYLRPLHSRQPLHPPQRHARVQRRQRRVRGMHGGY